MKAITDVLDISRSNQYERKKGRRRYGTRKDDGSYLPLVREITDNLPTFGYLVVITCKIRPESNSNSDFNRTPIPIISER